MFPSGISISLAVDLSVEVLQALRNDVAIASVGPVMTASLEAFGIAADIIPNHPKMGPLVKAASESAPTILCSKRHLKQNS